MATKKSAARPIRNSSAAEPQDETLEAAKAAIASKGDNVHLRDVMRVLHALVTSKEQGLPKNRRLALNLACELLGELSSGRLTPDALFEYGAIESLGELMRRKGWLREPDPEAVPLRGVEDWKLTKTERQNRCTEDEICRLHESGATGRLLQALGQYPDVLDATGLASVKIRLPGQTLKEPSKRAVQCYRLCFVQELSQTEVAMMLSKEWKRKVHQGQVSRWCDEVNQFVKAGGVLPPLNDSSPPVRLKKHSVDPGKLDYLRNPDGRVRPHKSPLQRDDE